MEEKKPYVKPTMTIEDCVPFMMLAASYNVDVDNEENDNIYGDVKLRDDTEFGDLWK